MAFLQIIQHIKKSSISYKTKGQQQNKNRNRLPDDLEAGGLERIWNTEMVIMESSVPKEKRK